MGKKVLIVDDSATIRQMVRMTLARAEKAYELAEAEDGAKALQKLSAESFDLVVSDLNMPVMTGMELLRGVRQLPQYKFTPFLLLTTESQPEKKQEGKAAGATGWIVKPFDPEQLLAVVAKTLRC